MDLRHSEWHGQMIVSGIGEVRVHSGPMVVLMAQFLKDLAGVNPRALTDGQKEIVIRLSDVRATLTKQELTNQQFHRTMEVIAGLDLDSTDDEIPRPGETFAQFRDRLIMGGATSLVAVQIASTWFEDDS